MRNILAAVFICVFFCQAIFSQNIAAKLSDYQNSHHLEKLYINHDKPYYRIGDTIWCKAYYLDAKTHLTFDMSPLVFVELISPNQNVVTSYILKIDKGRASFELPLDQSLEGGSYRLKAYTQYQKNFNSAFIFEKNIDVYKDSSGSKKNKRKG